MNKTIRFLSLTSLTALLLGAGSIADAASLKQQSVVTGSAITVGDIFDGLTEEQASYVLGPAPQPGQDMTLNAATLAKVARVVNLDWRPITGAEFTTLRSAATAISQSVIENALKKAVEKEGIKGPFRLLINSNTSFLTLPADYPASVEIETIIIKKEVNLIEASIVAPSLANPMKRAKVHAAIEQLVEIPVLNKAMQFGDIIRKDDLDSMMIPESQLRRDYIVSADSLIGMTPRRAALAQEPLSVNNVEAPQLIKRGEFVTMIYNNGTLNLTTKGKALEHGTKNDIIRVVNTSTNRTIEGRVTGPKEILIETF